jgi:streptomycin 6-kinase
VIQSQFAHIISEIHGETGSLWLEELPRLLEWCEQTWRLRLSAPFPDLSYNYVAPARTMAGDDVVVKVGVPTRELLREMSALEAFAGRGAVRLLECDPDRGAMLLERLRPGRSLDRARESQLGSARIGAGVLRELWRPPVEAGGWQVQDWLSEMDRKAPALLATPAGRCFPGEWLDRARELSARCGDGEPVLLHGDFHHGNILSDGDGWRAIDAWGIVGAREWEIGAFLLNAVPDDLPLDALADLLRAVINVFATELGLDREKIRDLSVVRAVLSAFWSLEDLGSGWEPALRLAEVLAALRPMMP